MAQRVAVLFSGGKDSTYAVWVLQHQGWEIASLVTVKPRKTDSWMFHYPNVEWTPLQAEAMGLPHRMVEGGGLEEVTDLSLALSKMKEELDIVGVATGAVASDYQKVRFDNMCDRIGLRSFSPLWRKKASLLVNDLRKSCFRTIMTAVAAGGLDKSWLGKELANEDWTKLADLSWKYGINLSGEGGEYESFVLDAPHFAKMVRVEESRTVWDGQSGRLVIEKASLGNKLLN